MSLMENVRNINLGVGGDERRRNVTGADSCERTLEGMRERRVNKDGSNKGESAYDVEKSNVARK